MYHKILQLKLRTHCGVSVLQQVMGILALFSESDHLAQLTNEKGLF